MSEAVFLKKPKANDILTRTRRAYVNVYVVGNYQLSGMIDMFIESKDIQNKDQLLRKSEPKSAVKYIDTIHKYIIVRLFRLINLLGD